MPCPRSSRASAWCPRPCKSLRTADTPRPGRHETITVPPASLEDDRGPPHRADSRPRRSEPAARAAPATTPPSLIRRRPGACAAIAVGRQALLPRKRGPWPRRRCQGRVGRLLKNPSVQDPRTATKASEAACQGKPRISSGAAASSRSMVALPRREKQIPRASRSQEEARRILEIPLWRDVTPPQVMPRAS